MKTRTVFFGILVIISGSLSVRAQETVEPDIQKRIDLIKRGNIEQVRAELPSLLERYPNNPGILYLQGMLTSNGGEAVRTFQNLVDNFPKSDWADDALYKIYQYYYALGLYKTADQKLEKLRQDYPHSPYLRSIQQQVAMQPELPRDTAQQLQSGVEKPKVPAQSLQNKPEVKPRPAVTGETPAEIKKDIPPAPSAVVPQKETPPVSTASGASGKKELVKTSPVPSGAQKGTGGYTVQTGVFSSRLNAEKYQSDLMRAAISTEVKVRQIGGREMYAVCVGSYATYEEAQRYVESLKEKNIIGIVIGR